MAKIRLVVADDNPHVLEQVALVLRADFEVVGRAADGRQAVDAATRLQPDAVVLDITMPGMSGLRAAEELRKHGSEVPIVFLTVHDDEEFVRYARAAGGLGYVLKSRMVSDLGPAIRAALAGLPFLSKSLA